MSRERVILHPAHEVLAGVAPGDKCPACGMRADEHDLRGHKGGLIGVGGPAGSCNFPLTFFPSLPAAPPPRLSREDEMLAHTISRRYKMPAPKRP